MSARKMTKTDILNIPSEAGSRTKSTKLKAQSVTPSNGLAEENAQHHVEEARELFPVVDDELDPQTYPSLMTSLNALESAQRKNLHELKESRKLEEENNKRLHRIQNKLRKLQAQLEAIMIMLEASVKTGPATHSL